MKFLFVMDPLPRIHSATDTTWAIMQRAGARGHEIWHCEPRHLGLEHDRPVAIARPVTTRLDPSDVAASGAARSTMVEEYAAVFIRKDPPFDGDYATATLLLERARGQTTFINDPRGLRECNEKLAVLNFPELTPPTLVTRDAVRLRAFLDEQGGQMMVKPLDGAGGFGVFHARDGDSNLGAILEQATLLGSRWALAQRYVPAVRQGDKRILVCDGEPLCAVLRVPAPDDARCNLHVGGRAVRTTLDERDHAIITAIAPYLRSHGLFFAGIDVIGGWLTEINVTSPTGIREASALDGEEHDLRLVERVEALAASRHAGPRQ
jgi:glutathione synthase